jgi:2-desacetyl-2-hydroxyethyl bacteriochlorophyllide A dehydrogenase
VRAARWDGPGELTVVDLPEPQPKDGQVVVEISACGICGSDLHAYRDAFLAQPGQVLGHEFSGRVVAAPGVRGIGIGDRVAVRPQIPCRRCTACRDGRPHLCELGPAAIIGYGAQGAFAERVLVPRAVLGETVFVLPPSVDDRGGALVEPLAVGLRAVKQAGDVVGATALVLGAGMIGLAVTQFLRLNGAETIVVADPSSRRRDAALILGADVVVDPDHDSTVTAVQAVTGRGPGKVGARADVVIDCAGSPTALADGLAAARSGGTVVLCAVYAAKVSVRPDWIVSKELIVRGSFGYGDEFREVLAALEAGHVDPSAFISHELPLERIAEAFRTQSDPNGSLKVLVCPGRTD